MSFLLRFILLVIVMFLLIRAVMRFLAKRFLKQQWPFRSLHQNGRDGTPSSGAAEEADFEVVETNIKENEGQL